MTFLYTGEAARALTQDNISRPSLEWLARPVITAAAATHRSANCGVTGVETIV